MKTLTIKQGGANLEAYNEGWHEFTVKTAKYAKGDGSPYLTMTFVEAPDNFNCRIYEVKNRDGEEFAIANVFRFANAGIQEEVLTNSDGSDTKVLQLDDKPEHLIGKKLNVLVYKIENEQGSFSRCFKQVAPTVLEGVAETFTKDNVDYFKGQAVRQWNQYRPNEAKYDALDERTGLPTLTQATTNGTDSKELVTDDDIPF